MAPKEKRDPTWLHYQLIDGKMVCNYCQKEVGGGGIHRIKQHLAHARGNIKPCLKVSDNLKAEMFALLESYQAEKAKHKKIQSEIGRSSSQMESRERIPSFEESSSFPIPLHDPYKTLGKNTILEKKKLLVAVHQKGPVALVTLSHSLYPTLRLVLSLPLMPNGRRWKGRLHGNVLLDGGMMQTYLSMLQSLSIINLCWML